LRTLDILAERSDDLRTAVGSARQDRSAAGFKMQPKIARPGAHVSPMLGVHHVGVERILEEDSVEFLGGAIVEQLAIVPALEAEAIGVDAERPRAGGSADRDSGG
jgi:hypothetical protein